MLSKWLGFFLCAEADIIFLVSHMYLILVLVAWQELQMLALCGTVRKFDVVILGTNHGVVVANLLYVVITG